MNLPTGQGFIILTPLGVHNVISAVAAGRLYRDSLENQKSLYRSGGKRVSAGVAHFFALSQKSLEILREGLSRVTVSGTGTYHKHLSPVLIAGKTGSAQNIKSKTHSWFTAYGPIDKPLTEQYAVTVMVESSGHGGSIAVPVTSMIFNYLEKKVDFERALKTMEEILNIRRVKVKHQFKINIKLDFWTVGLVA